MAEDREDTGDVEERCKGNSCKGEANKIEN